MKDIIAASVKKETEEECASLTEIFPVLLRVVRNPVPIYWFPSAVIFPLLSIKAFAWFKTNQTRSMITENKRTGFRPCVFSIAPNQAYRSTNAAESMNDCVVLRNDTISDCEHC